MGNIQSKDNTSGLRFFLHDWQKLANVTRESDPCSTVDDFTERLLYFCCLPLNHHRQCSGAVIDQYELQRLLVEAKTVHGADMILERDFQPCMPRETHAVDNKDHFITKFLYPIDQRLLIKHQQGLDITAISDLDHLFSIAHKSVLLLDFKRVQVGPSDSPQPRDIAARFLLKQYLHEAVFNPVFLVLRQLDPEFHIKYDTTQPKRGYLVKCEMAVYHDKEASAVILTRSPYSYMGYGAKSHFHKGDDQDFREFVSRTSSDAVNRAVRNFYQAFDDGAKQCMALNCDKLVICDGWHFVLIEFSEKQCSSSSIQLASSTIVRYDDGGLTPRSALMGFLYSDSNTKLGSRDTGDELFKILLRPLTERMEHRRSSQFDARIKNWCLARPSHCARYFSTQELNLSHAEIRPISTGMGQDAQVIRIVGHNGVVFKIYDSYYDNSMKPLEAGCSRSEDPRLVNLAWHETNTYDLLQVIQGDAIPKLVQAGWCEITDASTGNVYCGLYLCLEDVATNPGQVTSPEEMLHYELACTSLRKIYQHNVVHNSLALNKLLLHEGKIYIVGLSKCTFVRGACSNNEACAADWARLKAIWDVN